RAVRTARPDEDGTNIGDAIVWSLEALRRAPPKKKVLILLTDGRNRPARGAGRPPIEPAAGADWGARRRGTLHSLAAGKAGGVRDTLEPATQLERAAGEVEGPDLALLERLAGIGQGHAFRATDAAALSRVFATIDSLEKSPVRGEVRTRYREEYGPWVG